MTCLQGTELPEFIQFSKENGQKLNKGMHDIADPH